MALKALRPARAAALAVLLGTVSMAPGISAQSAISASLQQTVGVFASPSSGISAVGVDQGVSGFPVSVATTGASGAPGTVPDGDYVAMYVNGTQVATGGPFSNGAFSLPGTIPSGAQVQIQWSASPLVAGYGTGQAGALDVSSGTTYSLPTTGTGISDSSGVCTYNYTSIDVAGALDVPFGCNTIQLLAQNSTVISGTINASDVVQTSNAGNGGNGPYMSGCVTSGGAGGGGGGGATTGDPGPSGTNCSYSTPGGTGGPTNGNTSSASTLLSSLAYGYAGGSGGADGYSDPGGSGGFGGALVEVEAANISLSGTVSAAGYVGVGPFGGDGGGGGGGGAGDVLLKANSISISGGTINVTGGRGGFGSGSGYAGQGGNGAILLDYNSFSGTAPSGAYTLTPLQ